MSSTPLVSARDDAFDRLLNAMPDIAQAVNAFDSNSTKRLAMQALLRAIGVPIEDVPVELMSDPLEDAPMTPPGTETRIVDEQPLGDVVPAEPSTSGSNGSRARRRKTSSPVQPIRDVDFWPADGQSLQQLVDEKQPRNIDQKNAVVAYWFEEISGLQPFGAGHVAAAYRAMKWKEPNDLANALQATASRSHFINTSKMKDLKLMPAGRNLVLHDLPTQSKAKTS